MSKYNNKKVHLDDYVFDSQAEANYYEGLKIRSARGEIQGFERQPVFNLQPAFKKQDKNFQAITYIADFLVYLPNGEVEVIDIKGMITETFNVKRKLFEYKYPHLQLILLKHVKKYGGFITLDEYNKLQRAEKRAKKQNKAE
ncbi:DUF1064 domain-containing protein [Bacillus cereus]|uniref:DUF1064 domain-containing protein n=1 Tax=Bacillus cereus TaxID=1396 RepID=A0AAW5L3M0_BACCE|nr:DUF1064 domain-containing protein [Bacillus cereus]MCQ6288862.1 DUF1064 domain-containing protein [Bacillus cereus]MCQ6318617.1 DUF1064 domain-containing protein [Bacillus cereus]MCQ6329820.1 DUF1064 domain-containing protein [Bacillus cereus]MCQ6386050.1 DUF1064 domain-containing protein [Bacillus cereus]